MKQKSRRRRYLAKMHQRQFLKQTHPKGSTLLIVMVLMGMLSLLGVIFYVFSAQERSNAEYYSEASKETSDPGLDADVLFDWALEQIIVGTDPRLKNSVLWGSRHSLLSNAVGFSTHKPDPNLHPFNGEGINVIYDAVTGKLGVDQNRNGLVDDPTVNAGEADNRFLLNYVDSPAASPNLFEPQLTNGSWPQTDVGYTYPDINNAFLCYVGKVRDNNGIVHQVVKPSYMVPGLFRPTASSAPNATWYNDPNTAQQVMRGHPNHYYVPPTSSPASPAPRYLTNAQATTVIGPGATGFPVVPMNGTFPVLGTSQGRIGAYSVVDTTNTFPPNEPVELDYDNDGDGICESILMDLDFPPQQDATGKLFVPLFLITIHDLDSLFNLTAQGNIAKVLAGPTDINNGLPTMPISSGGSGNWFGMDSGAFNFISQSNIGLGPAEINPIWGLNRRIGIDDSFTFTQHQAFFGNAPTAVTIGSSPSWGESGNMEFLWSKMGRFQTSPFDLYVGVYGEPAVLYNATNKGTGPVNSAPGGKFLPRPGLSMADDQGDLAEGQGFPPYFQQPLDFTGQGTILASAKTLAWTTAGGSADPANRWLKYTKYNDSNPSNIRWGQAAGLMSKSFSEGLGDDPYEVAYYATDYRDFDNPFSAEELLYLMLNNSEIDRLNINSRLSQLLPYNFDKTKGTKSRAEFIRRMFTVISNDRKSFSLPISPRSNNEYNLDANTNTLKFPPQFGGITRYSTAALAEDPFRPALRKLMEIEINGQQNITRLQRKLNINGVLVGDNTTPLSYRPLTPHPDDPGTKTIPSLYTAASMPAYPPVDAPTQEFWARRDRQQMARDIYVLLYLLGHGVDSTNVATLSTAYTPAQCAEMAQFAVNVVDALDRDSVITRFEYDLDLTNGWNLDDDPYTSPSTTPPVAESDRAEVFGVERLDLSISEAMAFKTEATTPTPMDHASTNYDDSKDHNFAYVELYNQSPFDVTFSNTETWQVVLKQTGAFERRLTFKSGAKFIKSGQRYTVGSADGDLGQMATGKSLFNVDPMGGSSFIQIAPYDPAVPPAMPTTKLDLDLIASAVPTTDYRVEDGTVNPPSDLTSTSGAWAAGLASGTNTNPLKIVLRRRVHPTRTKMVVANDNDNPWVTVDEMTLPSYGKFSLTNTDMATQIQTQLNKLESYERKQPLGDSTDFGNHGTSSMGVSNTLANINKNAVGTFDLWQPHFDRNFASIIDLFLVPAFGPNTLTTHLRDATRKPSEVQTTPLTGADFFLNPNTATPNRWHRLLEFVEVPTRTNNNLGLGTDLSIPRLPGRMNLNAIRYPDNLAGLLDDSRYYGLDLSAVGAGQDQPPRMPDVFEAGARDWWDQFIQTRDATDLYTLNVTAGATSLHLPGLPGSKPFRSLADVSYTAAGGTKTPSVEDTILRSLPADGKRRLLEVGNNGEHTAGSIDPTIRHRILSKIAGNSTTRSNCFAIFVSVKYFSAGADPAYNGAIRIGGPYNGKAEPEHRGFFVVDRSKLEQGKYTGAANYDFKAFIEYRKTLATQ